MLLTLTDGLLPVNKFDRSFREKKFISNPSDVINNIFQINDYFTEILFQQLQWKI